MQDVSGLGWKSLWSIIYKVYSSEANLRISVDSILMEPSTILLSYSLQCMKLWSSSSTWLTYTNHTPSIMAGMDIFLKANEYDILQRDIYRWYWGSTFATLNLKLFIRHLVKIRFLPYFCPHTKTLLCAVLLWTIPNLLQRSCQQKSLRHLGSMYTLLIRQIIFIMCTSMVCVNMSWKAKYERVKIVNVGDAIPLGVSSRMSTLCNFKKCQNFSLLEKL